MRASTPAVAARPRNGVARTATGGAPIWESGGGNAYPPPGLHSSGPNGLPRAFHPCGVLSAQRQAVEKAIEGAATCPAEGREEVVANEGARLGGLSQKTDRHARSEENGSLIELARVHCVTGQRIEWVVLEYDDKAT